ncbi:hypothetical protein ACK34J_02245 [Aeromonas veronii]|jgi:hypothetical protein
MKLNRDLGFYVPAFFMMQVDTDKPIENIIGTADERTFSHELIHFLQDVSTTYGLINISKCIDVIKSQNQALRSSSSAVSLPLEGSSLSESVMVNNDLFSIYVGDDTSEFQNFPSSVSVIAVKEEDMDVELIPYVVKYIEIEYGSQQLSETKSFHFGTMAICESMASLIEDEIYGAESRRKNFPYDSALMITEYLCPTISSNTLAIAELCEASLMYYNPGDLFVNALKKIRDDKIEFSFPNECYLFVLNNFTLEGEPANKEYLIASKQAESQLDDLFTVSPLKEEKWASGMVAKARRIRESNISISSQLWGSDKNKSRGRLLDSINKIGLPIVFNKNFDASLKASEEKLNTPLMFPAILSFHEILLGTKKGCYLYEHCSNQDSGYITNIHCQSEPWARIRQEKACYFSNIWKTWGLESVEITCV